MSAMKSKWTITGRHASRVAGRDGIMIGYVNGVPQITVRPTGWTGDATGANVSDFFRGEEYLGPDADGLEPTWEDATPDGPQPDEDIFAPWLAAMDEAGRVRDEKWAARVAGEKKGMKKIKLTCMEDQVSVTRSVDGSIESIERAAAEWIASGEWPSEGCDVRVKWETDSDSGIVTVEVPPAGEACQ